MANASTLTGHCLDPRRHSDASKGPSSLGFLTFRVNLTLTMNTEERQQNSLIRDSHKATVPNSS